MKQLCLLFGLLVFSLLGGYYSYAAEPLPEESMTSAVESAGEYPVALGVARDQTMQIAPTEEAEQEAKAPESTSSTGEFVVLVLVAVGSFLASVLLLLRYRKLKAESGDTAR